MLPDCRQMCCWGQWPPRTKRWPRRLLRAPSSRTAHWLQNVSTFGLAVPSHSRVLNVPPAEREHAALHAAAVLRCHSSQVPCLPEVKYQIGCLRLSTSVLAAELHHPGAGGHVSGAASVTITRQAAECAVQTQQVACCLHQQLAPCLDTSRQRCALSLPCYQDDMNGTPTPWLCGFHVGRCANKLSCSWHCLHWLPCLPAEKLAAAIQDLRKAEADKQKAMSQAAAANREADKLTQKLYKMPKARLLSGTQADCCVLCLLLRQQQGGALICCALLFAVCLWGQAACLASLSVQHSLQMRITSKPNLRFASTSCTLGHQPGRVLLIMLHPASQLHLCRSNSFSYQVAAGHRRHSCHLQASLFELTPS